MSGFSITGDLRLNSLVLASALAVGGDLSVNTNKFTVAAASGNTAIAGTLQVSSTVSLQASAVNLSGGYLGISSNTDNTATSASTIYYGHGFVHAIHFNSGSNGSVFNGTSFQQYLDIQGGATPAIINSFVVSPDTLGASPTGTLGEWNQFSVNALAGQHSGTASLTISTYRGLKIANASGSSITGVTLSNVVGAYIAGQVGGSTGYGLYVDSGNTTAGIYVADTKASTSTTTGSIVTAGGLGVAGAGYFGGAIFSTSPTAGIGYATGAGGTVTQATSKSTGVTLSKSSGQITMNAAALAAGSIVSFVLTNTAIAATDTLVINHVSGGTPGSYTFNAQCAAGSATINVRNNTAGSLSEAIVLQFTLIKGVNA